MRRGAALGRPGRAGALRQLWPHLLPRLRARTLSEMRAEWQDLGVRWLDDRVCRRDVARSLRPDGDGDVAREGRQTRGEHPVAEGRCREGADGYALLRAPKCDTVMAWC